MEFSDIFQTEYMRLYLFWGARVLIPIAKYRGLRLLAHLSLEGTERGKWSCKDADRGSCTDSTRHFFFQQHRPTEEELNRASENPTTRSASEPHNNARNYNIRELSHTLAVESRRIPPIDRRAAGAVDVVMSLSNPLRSGVYK